MLQSLHDALTPWYLQIKCLHVLFAMIWAFSTAVAYSYYVKGAFPILLLTGPPERYERAIRLHWRFLKVTTPLVMVFIPLLVWLAVTRPF